MRKFDRFDHLILQSIQVDDSIPVAELADKIGLSTNACWRRIKRLEETGVIRSRVALLDERALDLNVTVFVSIKTSQHTDSWLTKFANGVKNITEVIEFYRMSGDIDYLLKIVVRDIADYDRVYKKLIQVAPMSDVSSSFSMERIKSATTLPLDHLGNQ